MRCREVVVLCCLVSIGQASAESLFAEHFDTLDNWGIEGRGTGKVIEITSDSSVAHDGNVQGLHVNFPQSSWTNSSSGKRVEIYRKDVRLTQWREDRWYSLSLYVPVGYGRKAGATVDNHIAFQFHGSPDDWNGCSCPNDCDRWRSPPLALHIDPSDTGNHWNLFVRYSEQRYNCDGNGSVTQVDLAPYLDGWPMAQEGGWTTWTFHVVWDSRTDGQGLVEAWIQDSAHRREHQVLTYAGPVGFNDFEPPYIKMGIYHWTSAWPAEVSELELYYDRFLVGTTREDVQMDQGNYYLVPKAGMVFL